MMQQAPRSRFRLHSWREIPVTAALSLTLLIVSMVGSVTERNFGVGLSSLNYRVDAVLNLELWRLLTYVFVGSTTLSLFLDILVLWIFGGWFESFYGRRDYMRFFFASVIGAGLLAIPFTFIVNLLGLFHDPGIAEGPNPVFDAMLVALALSSPDSNILFGFVLPIRARTAIYIVLGMSLISGILTGAAALGITLGGMAIGYLLVTGNWRPSRLLKLLKLKRMRKRRSGLYVVPPKKDQTLH